MLLLIPVLLCLGTTYGIDKKLERYFQGLNCHISCFLFLYPVNHYGITASFKCPTPKLLTRVCNVYTDEPCWCGSTFSPQILRYYNLTGYICQPPPETLMFRVRIVDDVMSHKNLEKNLLTVFGTTFLNNSTYETNVTKIAETVKINSARCANHSGPYIEAVISVPGSYESVNLSSPVHNALMSLGYNMSAILHNKKLRILGIRLLKKSAVPNIFESMAYQNVTVTYEKVVKQRTFLRPPPAPIPSHFFVGLGLVMIGGVALAALLFMCYRVVREDPLDSDSQEETPLKDQ